MTRQGLTGLYRRVRPAAAPRARLEHLGDRAHALRAALERGRGHALLGQHAVAHGLQRVLHILLHQVPRLRDGPANALLEVPARACGARASGLAPRRVRPQAVRPQASGVRPSGLRPQAPARSATAPPHRPHSRPAGPEPCPRFVDPRAGRADALDGLADGHAALAGAGVLQVVLDQQQRDLAAERGRLARAAPASHSAPAHAWQRAAHTGCRTRARLHGHNSSVSYDGMRGPSDDVCFCRPEPPEPPAHMAYCQPAKAPRPRGAARCPCLRAREATHRGADLVDGALEPLPDAAALVLAGGALVLVPAPDLASHTPGRRCRQLTPIKFTLH